METPKQVPWQTVETQMKCQKCGILSESTMFAKIKTSSGTEVHLNLEILTCDPLICTMNPGFIQASLCKIKGLFKDF